MALNRSQAACQFNRTRFYRLCPRQRSTCTCIEPCQRRSLHAHATQLRFRRYQRMGSRFKLSACIPHSAFRIPHPAAHMRCCVITLTVSSAWPGAPALCAHPWHKAKKPRTFRLWAFAINGRRGGIRTRDPLHPMQVRYLAALHADKT